MNILITGADGQLGCEFQSLAKNYPDINFIFTNRQKLDITNEIEVSQFIASINIDYIINCAAYTAVDNAEEDVVNCDRINHAGASYLAKAASDNNAGFIHFSTDYVFDGTKGAPYTEDDPTSARVVYGVTKLASERVALARCKQTMIIRTSWLFSSFGNNFVKTVLKHLKASGKMRVVYDQIGSPTYAKDLAHFVINQIEKGIVPGLYNYSNEGTCSWYDFAKLIQRFSKIKGEIIPILSREYPTLAERPHYSVLDKTKIKETYNISIPYWVDSLEECINNISNEN